MHIPAGRLLLVHRYPKGAACKFRSIQHPGVRGRGGRECKTALKAPILSPNASRAARFLQDAAHGACLSLKIQYAGTLGC